MKLKVLSRDFGTNEPTKQFFLTEIDKPTVSEAWREVEENIATNMSQDWLLNEAELQALRELLK